MKKLIFILLLICNTVLSGYGQTTARRLPDETAVVKDSTGKQYDYAIWTALVATRRFSIKANGRKNPDDKYPEYLLYSLYDAQGLRIYKEGQNVRKPAESEQFKIGATFIPFKDKDINGEKLDMKKMPGKVFVINFWFIGCPPCRAEIPDLNRVVEHYKDNKDVVFIAICLDDAYPISDFIKTTPYNYHIIDNGRYLSNKYGVHLYPTNLVVNKEGKVAYSSVSNQSTNPYWIIKTVDEALKATTTAATM
jgi:thiol-disulfide isomerase/thioredoxin